jgi:hypothetical protein
LSYEGVFGSFGTVEEVTEEAQTFLEGSFANLDEMARLIAEKKDRYDEYVMHCELSSLPKQVNSLRLALRCMNISILFSTTARQPGWSIPTSSTKRRYRLYNTANSLSSTLESRRR